MYKMYKNEFDSKLDAIWDGIYRNSYKYDAVNQFTLASGRKSSYYFNLKQVLLAPEYSGRIAWAMLEMIKHVLKSTPDAISGLTMGADPIIYGVSHYSSGLTLPLPVRKNTKDHGSKKRVEGLLDRLFSDAQIALVDDVITTGGSTIQALDALEELGYKFKYAFCVLDRNEGGREALAERGIEIVSLFTKEDFPILGE